MTKLIHLWCLLCFVVSLSAQEVSESLKTYTISVKKLTTTFDNVLVEPIPKLNITDYQNVASTGDYQLNIEFTKGLMTKQLIVRKDTDRTYYHKPYYDSPTYTLKITDFKGNLLLENTYGGVRENIDWGKSQKFTTSDAAYQEWRMVREKVWKELELKSIDLTKMNADIITFFDSLKSVKKIDLTDTNPSKPESSDVPSSTLDEEKQTTIIAKKKSTAPTVKKRTDDLIIKLVGSGIN